MTATWILFAAYLAVTVWLAWLGARRTTTFRSFALGGGDLSPWVTGLALAASMTSTATFLINPGIVWAYGVSALLGYGLAAGLGLGFGIVILSKGFRRHGQRQEILTVPSWLGSRYGDRRLTFFYGLVSLLLLAMVVLIAYALAGLSVVVLGLDRMLGGQAFAWALGGIIAFVFLYTTVGGTYAHAYTNTAQGILMLIAAVILLVSGIEHLGPGMLDRLAAIDPGLAQAARPDSLLFRNLFEVFGVNLIVGFALAVQPHFINKALYVKTDREVNQYLATAIVLGTVFTSLLLCGLYARLGYNEPISRVLEGSRLGIDGVMPLYIAQAFSPVVSAFISVAVLAAGMSTLDGLLIALSAILANDIFLSLTRDRERHLRTALRVGQASLLVGGVVTFFLALSQHRTKELSIALFAQDGVYALFAATCLPVLFGLFPGWLPRKGAVVLSSLAALAVHFGFRNAKLTLLTAADWTNPGLTVTYGLAAALLVIGVDWMLARSTLKEGDRPRVGEASPRP